MRRYRLLSCSLLLCVALLAPTVHAIAASSDPSARLAGIDEFITAAMTEWKVPGLAVAAIQDGKVVLSKGYGFRNVEQKLPVTPNTLFAIGSNSKSFTVTVLGMLVDDGKLEWDKPLREYLPDFRMHDPAATAGMTPRDLVTHRSGLPRHDGMWYGSGLSREQMYQRLRYLQPSRDFRSFYQYQNLMFMTAGYLAGKISGSGWEELVRARILNPLGMTRSNFSVRDSQKDADHALPYEERRDQVVSIPFRNIDEIGPAGSINSSVEEMMRYIEMHINLGKAGDKQLLARTNAQQMQTPQMVMPGSPDSKELSHSAYGMGLVVTAYRGHKLVQHGGGIDGFISGMSWMPAEKIGVMVLTNLSGNNPLTTLVARNIYDRLLGLEVIDWAARTREQQEKAKKAAEETKKKNTSARREGTSPSHALSEYAGDYENPAYGRVRIEASNPGLKYSFREVSGDLKHHHYDIFEVAEQAGNPLSESKLTFFYNKKGDIDRVAVPLEPNVDDIVFTRMADERMKQRAFLDQLVGEYTLGPQVVTVALRGEDTLTLAVPGQPTYELVPTRGTTFALKGVTGFSVEFKVSGAAKAEEAVFFQPNGTFVARRK